MSEAQDAPGKAVDMGDWHDLTAFQRDLLRAVRALENTTDETSGMALKHDLEIRYAAEVTNPRVYQNLDELVNRGLVAKAQADGRTNEYTLTTQGGKLLDARLRRDIALRTPRLDSQNTSSEDVEAVDLDDLDADLPPASRFEAVANRDDIQTIRGLARELDIDDPALVRVVTHRLDLYDNELKRPEGRPDEPTAQEADD